MPEYFRHLLFVTLDLSEVGNRITVAATLMLSVVFVSPMIKLVNASVNNVLDDQFM